MPSSSRPIDQALGIAFDPAATGFAALQVQAAIEELNAIVAQTGSANTQGTRLISGGGVAWVTGYTYQVSAASYYIAGVAHESAAASVTLVAPHATYGRFDAIVVDDTGAVVVLTGTPSPSPELPDVDPLHQLSLTLVRVDAGTVMPPAIVSIPIYVENAGPPAEWALTSSAGTIVLASTSNPHGGTKCIEATGATNGTYVEATVSPAITAADGQNRLVFWVRAKAGWPVAKSLTLTWRTATAQVGAAVVVGDGTYGFNTAITASYQQVVIPLTAFTVAAGTQVTKLRITATGGGSGVGFFLDDVSLQAGVDSPESVQGITQVQGDARYAQRAANLSDLTSAPIARANLDLAATYRFGAAGVITTGQKAPAHRVRAAGTAFLLEMTMSAGTATAAVVASTDGGSTWPTTVGTVAIASGIANSASISTALAAGTLLRVNYTAAGGTAADPVVSLHVR